MGKRVVIINVTIQTKDTKMDYIVDMQSGTVIYLDNARIVRNVSPELIEEDDMAIVYYAEQHGTPVQR